MRGDDQVAQVGHLPGEARLRHLPRQPDPRARGRRHDVQDEVRQPGHEPALRRPADDALLHHVAEPRLRRRRLDAARRLARALHQRERPVQRGHHAHVQALLLRPVPPRGRGRALRHGVPLRVLRAPRPRQRAAAHAPRPEHLPPRPRVAQARPARGLRRVVHRPGRRVRLLRVAGDQGAPRGGHRGRAHQPEHRHGADVARGRLERPARQREPGRPVQGRERRLRGPRLPPAGHRGERAHDPRQGERHRRHHRLHGRPDGVKRRHRALGQRGPPEARHPRAGHEHRRDHLDRGPRDLLGQAPRDQRDFGAVLPGLHRRRGPRRRAQDRLPRARPRGVHAGGFGLGLRGERRRIDRPGEERPRGRHVHHQTDPHRPGPARLEGGRVRGRPRRPRQLHHGLQHGELRPARRAHGRLYCGGPVADALEPRVLQAPVHGHQGHPPHRHRRRVQHPVRARSPHGEVLHHRGQRAPLAVVGPRVQGHGLPPRLRGDEALAGPGPRVHPQFRDRHDDRVLRAVARLLRRQDAALGHAQVQPRVDEARQRHEVRRRGHGHRPDVRGVVPEGAAHGRPGEPGLRARRAAGHGRRRARAEAGRAHGPPRLVHRRGHVPQRRRLGQGPGPRAHEDRRLVPLAPREDRRRRPRRRLLGGPEDGPRRGRGRGLAAAREAARLHRRPDREAARHVRRRRARRAQGPGRHARRQADRHARRGVRGADELPLHDVPRRRRRRRVRRGRPRRHHGPGQRALPHRVQRRVRLVRRVGHARAARVGPARHHGQLQPRDRVDGLRRVRRALLRGALQGARHGHLRHGEGRQRRRRLHGRPDPPEPRRARARGRGNDPRHAPRHDRRGRGPLQVLGAHGRGGRRPAQVGRAREPRVRRGLRRRRRLPRARPAVVRAQRRGDEGLPRRGVPAGPPRRRQGGEPRLPRRRVPVRARRARARDGRRRQGRRRRLRAGARARRGRGRPQRRRDAAPAAPIPERLHAEPRARRHGRGRPAAQHQRAVQHPVPRRRPRARRGVAARGRARRLLPVHERRAHHRVQPARVAVRALRVQGHGRRLRGRRDARARGPAAAGPGEAAPALPHRGRGAGELRRRQGAHVLLQPPPRRGPGARRRDVVDGRGRVLRQGQGGGLPQGAPGDDDEAAHGRRRREGAGELRQAPGAPRARARVPALEPRLRARGHRRDGRVPQRPRRALRRGRLPDGRRRRARRPRRRRRAHPRRQDQARGEPPRAGVDAPRGQLPHPPRGRGLQHRPRHQRPGLRDDRREPHEARQGRDPRREPDGPLLLLRERGRDGRVDPEGRVPLAPPNTAGHRSEHPPPLLPPVPKHPTSVPSSLRITT
mmetsp:Transcript_29334/g.95937  ORF Transcript_29334/g.95937 Transcript_29334/m.95937 type:complete len:1339 (+) Transcript_29334:961-4977(+)